MPMIFNGKKQRKMNEIKKTTIFCSCSLRCASFIHRQCCNGTLIPSEDFFFWCIFYKEIYCLAFLQKIANVHIFNCSVYALFINYYYYYLSRNEKEFALFENIVYWTDIIIVQCIGKLYTLDYLEHKILIFFFLLSLSSK